MAERLAGPGTVDGYRIPDGESSARERYQDDLAVVLQEDRDVPATDRAYPTPSATNGPMSWGGIS